MLLRRSTPALAAALLAGLLVFPAVPAFPTFPVVASGSADQELPFTCAEQWTGTTRATHRPSPLSIDFNRDADLGRLVLASASGIVSRVEDAGDQSYGKWVRIEHPDGLSTLYAHLRTQWVVPGQFVDQGTPIGRVGDTGGVTNAHLHYEQRRGSTVQQAVFHESAFAYGGLTGSQNCPDVPLVGDWDGDQSDEVAVFRREAGAGTFELSSPSGVVPVRFGRASDLPVTGDWDGDGVTDVGVRRQATRAFLLRSGGGVVTRMQMGLVKDVPVAGDWDGSGTTDLGLWRPEAARFRLLRADGTYEVVALGSRASQPVTGDWDGDGATDLGVFDASTATFQLRTVSAAGLVTIASVPLGSGTDLPVAGDWNGDGTSDVGVWTPETATYTLRLAPVVTPALRSSTGPAELRSLVFGRPR